MLSRNAITEQVHAISFNLERKRALPEVSTVFEKEERK